MLAGIKNYTKLPTLPRIKSIEPTTAEKKKKRKPTMQDIEKLFKKLGVPDKKRDLDINAFLKTLN